MITVTPVTPAFVAEIEDIDLRQPLDPAQVAEISAAIDRYAVLVFRGQSLDNEQQLAFSANFGPLETTRQANRPGHKLRLPPQLSDISNLDESSRLLSGEDYRRLNGFANRLWHTDSTYKRVPARFSLLSAHVVPEQGGETEFADMRAAYDALPEKTKAQIDGLVAEHSIYHSRGIVGFTNFTDQERAALPPVPQALVRTHPGSGRRTLYLASHAGRIYGMPVPEGRMLLAELTEHATQRQFVHAHRWRAGDLVMWDDRCTMHRARPYDTSQVRDMRRSTVSDEVPTVAVAPAA
jgi:alpha-ketoglutarate-dependent 2,4-dichlorophenoxyacetate dioxygenase